MTRLFVFITVLFILPPIVGSQTKGLARTNKIKHEITVVLDTLTVYNPCVGQCDSTPLITASSANINMSKLRKNKVRWMAISRHLLKRWRGKFNYGDIVRVTSGDPSIDGLWIIKDTMNKRHKYSGDLLFHSDVRKLGRWTNVRITKI